MAYELHEINRRASKDPTGFLTECDREYDEAIEQGAEAIIGNLDRSPIVLLSGPSGSGKTTTALRLRDELSRRGIRSHSISLDNYFHTVHMDTMPRTEEGEPDFESPLCLDMELLNEHFSLLAAGERVFIPYFDFPRGMRSVKPGQSLKLGKNEVAIFEGIHALNDSITTVHPEAFRVYVSARSNIIDGETGELVCKGSWLRLIRRVVRDDKFRGAAPTETMTMWATVRDGEKKYINPFKRKADLTLDTVFPYEACVFATMAQPLFAAVPEGIGRREDILAVSPALRKFVPIDPALLAPNAMLREFLGGGIYA